MALVQTFHIKFHRSPQRGFRSGCFVRSALFHADCSRRSSCFRVLSFRRVCRSPLSVLVHLWFAILFEEVCPITTLGWRVCGSVLFFHSRLARLWFDLCPNGPVGRVASLPDHAAMRRPGSDRNLPCVRSWSTSLRLSVLLTCR